MEDELEQRAADYLSSVLGFNGERIDPVLGGYHLGNGYRLYSPGLRRFTSPDNLSPFGAGGINPYAYCEGDPINNTDPTGHFGIFGAIINVGMFVADVFTDGAASAAEEAMILARGEDVIAVRAARQAGNKAIRSEAEAASVAKYGERYPSQGELGHANFKLFRPDREILADRERTKGLKSLSDLMGSVGGYTDNFNGTREPGLSIHGSYGVLKYNQYGVLKTQPTLDALKTLDKNYGLKLFGKTDTPLHILACRTSSPVLGEELSTALERPVVLYGTDDELLCSNTREMLTGFCCTIYGSGNDPEIFVQEDMQRIIAAQRTYFPKF